MLLPSGQSRTAILDETYVRLLGLCDVLETIADSLPHLSDLRLIVNTATQLKDLVEATHRLEEEVLFPMLLASAPIRLNVTVARLRNEHVTDQCAAGEVGDALINFTIDRSSLSPDAIGYLLRSFFESVRRHVNSERELIRLFPLPDHDEAH